ncbi:27379_t:CDS:1, partial [Dentiscutata erythropus]
MDTIDEIKDVLHESRYINNGLSYMESFSLTHAAQAIRFTLIKMVLRMSKIKQLEILDGSPLYPF